MTRSSSSSSRSSFSSSRSSFRPSSKIAPSTSTPTISTPVHHNIKVEQPGFFSNMWQGFGMGAGQAIAHNIFRSDPVVKHVHENTSSSLNTNTESIYSNEFTQCLKEKYDDKDICKQYIQCLKDNNHDKNLCKQFM